MMYRQIKPMPGASQEGTLPAIRTYNTATRLRNDKSGNLSRVKLEVAQDAGWALAVGLSERGDRLDSGLLTSALGWRLIEVG